MAVWNPNGSGNVHYDQVLTNVSLEYPNNGLVGEALFPSVPVRKQSDKYYVFGRESWLLETDTYRAPGTEANEIPGRTVSLDTYYAKEHALQIAVTDEERENSDDAFAPDRDGTELVTSKILLSREYAMMTMVTTAANYATGLSTTLSGTAQWSDYTGSSHPITNCRTAVRAIHAKVFFEPNAVVIPYQVMSYLQDHPDIIARIQYAERAVLTQEIIGAVLGLNGMKVIVPGVGADTTSGVGTDGFHISAGYLWGKDVIFAYVPGRPGLRTPAFAYEFNWTYGTGTTQAVDRWREDPRKSDLIRVGRRYDLKPVGVDTNPDSADVGKWITGYVIKAAVA